MKPTNWNDIRAQYPIFDTTCYLRTMGGGPLSVQYTTHAQRILDEIQTKGRVWEEYTKQSEIVRGLLADMVNGRPDDVVFLPTVSYGMNIIADMLPTDAEILTFADEYPSNTLPFLHKGFALHTVASDPTGYISFENIKATYTKSSRVLIVSHVEYQTGFKHNLKKLGEFCRKNNLLFIVDATQSCGVIDIDMTTLGIDVLIYSAHKWLCGGYGIAVMHIRQSLFDEFGIPCIGGNSIDTKTKKLKKNASVLELGHLDFQSILPLESQLHFIQSIGVPTIEHRVQQLTAYLYKKAEKLDITILNTFASEHRSSIVRLQTGGRQKKALEQSTINCKIGDDSITVGISYYNSTEDIDLLCGVLSTK